MILKKKINWRELIANELAAVFYIFVRDIVFII